MLRLDTAYSSLSVSRICAHVPTIAQKRNLYFFLMCPRFNFCIHFCLCIFHFHKKRSNFLFPHEYAWTNKKHSTQPLYISTGEACEAECYISMFWQPTRTTFVTVRPAGLIYLLRCSIVFVNTVLFLGSVQYHPPPSPSHLLDRGG